MQRLILKWNCFASLAICLMAVVLPAQTQQSIKPVGNITAAPGLKTHTPIATPTSQSQGREPIAPGTTSPFSRANNNENQGSSDQGVRYPDDLVYQGGPTVESAEFHSIFINPTAQCAPNSCWGDPIGFLRDLSESQFIGVTDQYVNSSAPDRYSVGQNFYVPTYSPSSGPGMPFTDLDMAVAAYFIASQSGSFGYGHVYHLFLTPGQDICFDNTFSTCYSPDKPSSFAFCGYHSSVSDTSGNVVLYTVEPYQNVPGCNVRPGTPNGQLADSTNNVVSHETFETVTDPLGSAWWNSDNVGAYGQEIGDECSFVIFTSTSAYFDPSVVRLNHTLYAVQPEYSNAAHGCATFPAD